MREEEEEQEEVEQEVSGGVCWGKTPTLQIPNSVAGGRTKGVDGHESRRDF